MSNIQVFIVLWSKGRVYVVCFQQTWIFRLCYSENTHITPSNGALYEKLTVHQLVKTFPSFYETWNFITVIITARHLSLFWVKLTQSMQSHLTSTLILSRYLHLGLQSDLDDRGTIVPFPAVEIYISVLQNLHRPAMLHPTKWASDILLRGLCNRSYN